MSANKQPQLFIVLSLCLLVHLVSGAYPTHTVNATCFWVNEPADSSNAGTLF